MNSGYYRDLLRDIRFMPTYLMKLNNNSYFNLVRMLCHNYNNNSSISSICDTRYFQFPNTKIFQITLYESTIKNYDYTVDDLELYSEQVAGKILDGYFGSLVNYELYDNAKVYTECVLAYAGRYDGYVYQYVLEKYESEYDKHKLVIKSLEQKLFNGDWN